MNRDENNRNDNQRNIGQDQENETLNTRDTSHDAERGTTDIASTAPEQRTNTDTNTATVDNREENNNPLEESIFDRFMDTIMSVGRGRSQGTSREGETRSEGGAMENRPTGGNAAPENQTSYETPSGAIIITVNYVFSDENNPQNPNRSGSLVLTLPNNPSNRDPRFIQEFIRLATQMAYSTIVSGLSKSKGITLEKFNSFLPTKEHELSEECNTCSICFDNYEFALNDVMSSSMDETILLKKRKLNYRDSKSTDSLVSESSTNSNERSERNSGDRLGQPTDNAAPVKFLADFKGTFGHVPIQMPCGHIFGKSCLFEWLKNHNTCPLCRSSVSDGEDHSANTTSNVRNEETLNPNIRVINRPMHFGDFFSFNRDNESSNANMDTPSASRHEGSDANNARSGNNGGEISGNLDINSTGSIETGETGDSESSRSRNNNPGVFSHLLTYIRNNRRGAESLFPIGVASRRTNDGVETSTTESRGSSHNNSSFTNSDGSLNSSEERPSTNNSAEVSEPEDHTSQ